MSSNHPRPFSDNIYQPVQRDPDRDDHQGEGTDAHTGGGNSSSRSRTSNDNNNYTRTRSTALADTSEGDRIPARATTKDSAAMADDQQRVSRQLTRIQVITPLAILVNLAALAVCSVLVNPGLGAINEMHVTQFTPNPAFIALFWAVLFLLQIGFAVLAVAGQKEMTRVSAVRRRGKRSGREDRYRLTARSWLPSAHDRIWYWHSLGNRQLLPRRLGSRMGHQHPHLFHRWARTALAQWPHAPHDDHCPRCQVPGKHVAPAGLATGPCAYQDVPRDHVAARRSANALYGSWLGY